MSAPVLPRWMFSTLCFVSFLRPHRPSAARSSIWPPIIACGRARHLVHGERAAPWFAQQDRRGRELLEREREQRVAGEDRGRLVELLVHRGTAAPQVVVVERGQVVVDERERVHALERGRRGHHPCARLAPSRRRRRSRGARARGAGACRARARRGGARRRGAWARPWRGGGRGSARAPCGPSRTARAAPRG